MQLSPVVGICMDTVGCCNVTRISMSGLAVYPKLYICLCGEPGAQFFPPTVKSVLRINRTRDWRSNQNWHVLLTFFVLLRPDTWKLRYLCLAQTQKPRYQRRLYKAPTHRPCLAYKLYHHPARGIDVTVCLQANMITSGDYFMTGSHSSDLTLL